MVGEFDGTFPVLWNLFEPDRFTSIRQDGTESRQVHAGLLVDLLVSLRHLAVKRHTLEGPNGGRPDLGSIEREAGSGPDSKTSAAVFFRRMNVDSPPGA